AEGGPFWQELRHTADWAIRVKAPSLRRLYARAAAAMYRLQDADPARPITLARVIRAEADGPADLLVSWLNRLLLAQEVAGEMYTRFEIHAISARGVLGVAYGYEGAPSHTAVKAVTYHDLMVERGADGWSAQVVFDV
ncbi:MAG: archease, partial [Anaerolineae bacterium]